MVWTAWLYSQEWWRQELWKTDAKPGTTLEQVIEEYRTHFIPNADANNLILQLRTWEQHDVGTTPGFDGDVKKALGSIKAQVLYMPSATDLYFPVADARVSKRRSSRIARCCRSRRCGGIRRERERVPPMRSFSTSTLRDF